MAPACPARRPHLSPPPRRLTSPPPHPVSLEEICVSLRATPAVVKVWKRLLAEDKFVHIALGKSETCGRPCQYYSLTPAGYAYLISLAAKAKPQPKTPTP